MTTLNERLRAKTKQGGVFRRRNGLKRSGKTNGADLFLCAIVTHYDETNVYDFDLCDYDEIPDGIVMELADDANNLGYDAQNPISDNVNIKVCKPAKDDEFLTVLGSGKGCTIHHLAVIDVDNPGFVEDFNADEESIAAIPPFRIIGQFMETLSAVSGKPRHAWTRGL